MIPPASSLVKYDTPTLVSTGNGQKKKSGAVTTNIGTLPNANASINSNANATNSGTNGAGTNNPLGNIGNSNNIASNVAGNSNLNALGPNGGTTNGNTSTVNGNGNGSNTASVALKTSKLMAKQLPPVENKGQASQTEDILNAILPPREWVDEGQLWVQHVASTPATRLDVINLQEQLDLKLQQRQARETGICPVRQELYAQTFDELIRQVTVNCAERGLLLLRIRDEIRMAIAAYQTLYESSIAFGMRKALQAEQGRADMENKINQLQTDRKELEREVMELKAKCDAIEKRENERRSIEEKKHLEEVSFLKRTNQQLKQQLESILAPTKK